MKPSHDDDDDDFGLLVASQISLPRITDNNQMGAIAGSFSPASSGRAIAIGRKVDPTYTRYQVVGDAQKGEFHLRIQDAQLEDGGTYTCNILGLTPKEAELTVVVPVPQPPTLSGAEVPGTAGQQLELSCTSSGGNPPPQLTWYDGTEEVTEQQVNLEERDGRVEAELILRRLTRWDNGMNLTCRASQPFPEITSAQDSWTVLRVHYPPTVTVPIPSVRVIEGDSADLACRVDSNPLAAVSWTRPGRPALYSGNIGQKSLRIPSTSRQDAGTYRCTADNGVPPSAVGTVALEVLYPQVINPSMDDKVTALQDDDGFSLNCLAEGHPKPKVTWRRKDTKLYWENPLRFNRVRYDVEGTYQCVATSDGFLQKTKDVFIDVVGEGDTTMISADTGETVRLGCTVAADPLPASLEWTWRNNYGLETELGSADSRIVTTRRNQEMTSSVTLENVGVKDGGSYVCETTNMFGSAKRNVHLEVKEPFDLSTSRPMPPVPKYVYQTGTIDSGVEDLQELQEMYGTLKPRPPPRADKKWESVGLSYSGSTMVGRFSGELQLANSTCTPHIAVQGQSPVQLPERRKPTFWQIPDYENHEELSTN
ncbi:kin of IRRE-like protein 1 [Branchiostoma floridae x Branchiostoma japonicum]